MCCCAKACLTNRLFAATLAVFMLSAAAVAGEYQTIRDVPYVTRDGEALSADVFVPDAPGPLPSVLLVHGGAWRMGNKGHMWMFGDKLAKAGFTCVSINYRLAPKHVFPAQIEDCKSAVRWMRKNADQYKIDPARMGAVGYSAGGHLVALLGATDPSCGLEGPDADATSTRLQCVVAGGAPCDFRAIPPRVDMLAYWLGGTRADKPDIYDLASPQKFVTADDPPTLFFHGDSDALVPLFGPQAMVKRMGELGVACELCTLPGQGHIQAFLDGKARDESLKFLEAHLKNDRQPAAAK